MPLDKTQIILEQDQVKKLLGCLIALQDDAMGLSGQQPNELRLSMLTNSIKAWRIIKE